MISALVLTAILATEPPADKPAPSPPVCCAGHCVIPGACGQAACTCKPASGWRPPDEWRPYAANPAWEVFGREVDGVFRYRLRRRAARQPVPQVPAVGVAPGSTPPSATTAKP